MLFCAAAVLFSKRIVTYQVPYINGYSAQKSKNFFVQLYGAIYFVDEICVTEYNYNEFVGGCGMSSSDAQKRAIKKYDLEKIDRIAMRVPKGKREIIQTHAVKCGESVNAFLNRAVDEAIERDNQK